MAIRPLQPSDLGDGSLLVVLTRGLFAIIDAADGELVGHHNWCATTGPTSRTYYASTSSVPGRGQTYLHRLLWDAWGAPHARQIDHRNGLGWDCRRANLRAASPSENQHNKPKQANNTSGHKGVNWNKAGRCWVARISVHGREVHLGRFADIGDAVSAYEAAARRLHKDFARTA